MSFQAVAFSLLLSTSANAKVELLIGGFTYHSTNANDVASRFENKVSSDERLISNPLIGVSSTTDQGLGLYSRHLGFIGENSVGAGMAGYIYDEGGACTDAITCGLAVGGYLQRRRPFMEKGIAPFSIVNGGRDGADLVPVVGVTTGLKLSPGVTANLLLTPVICNLSFSLELK